MTTAPDNFTLVVISNKSLDVFPHNTSSDFKNQLPRSVDLRNYKVALTRMSWYDDFRKPVTSLEEPLPEIVVEEGNFFDTTKNDDKITVLKYIDSNFVFKKTFTNMLNFTTAFSRLLEDRGAKIVVDYKNSIPETASITNNNTSGYTIVIPEDLGRIFGFSRTTFQPGFSYKSDEAIDLANFNLFALQHNWTLSQYRWKKTEVTLEQIPLKKPSVSDITANIIHAVTNIRDERIILSMVLKEAHNAVEVDLIPLNVTIVLSPFLYRYLGLSESLQITGKQTLLIKPELINPENPVHINRSDIDNDISSPLAFVLSNTIEANNMFDEAMIPSLTTINRTPGEGKDFFYSPNRPIYLPATRSTLEHESITILDDKSEVIPAHEYPTTCELHFIKESWP